LETALRVSRPEASSATMSTPLRTPGSTRTRALGFTHDSDSDDDFSPGASSAARLASVRFGYPSAGVSSASRIRSRELAAARNFREASREKATLKQHCDALEEKVKALEQSLSETVEAARAQKELETESARALEETKAAERAAESSDEKLAAAANAIAEREAELASLRAELALATENHEWLRRALEARTAANAAAETQRQALSARVVELERIVDESEAHLSEVQTEREAQKMKYKKRVAAATAQRLAAEATNAMLKGEMARMRAQMDTRRLGGGVLEDVTNRAAIRMSKLQVHTTPGARVSEPSAMASPSCAKDDSAMGCVGPVEDGSESVSKPAGKRIVALSSPAAAMDFERAPEPFSGFFPATRTTRLATVGGETKGFFFLSLRELCVEGGGSVSKMAIAARLLASSLASALMRDAADARRGVRITPRTVCANLVVAVVVAACVLAALCVSYAAVRAFGMSLTYGVRMGGVPPQKTPLLSGYQKYAFDFVSFLNELRNGLRRLGGGVAA
jgi:chemotaxis protein histidine kinase CheA